MRPKRKTFAILCCLGGLAAFAATIPGSGSADPSSPALADRQAFDHRYEAWRDYIHGPEVAPSSTSSAYTDNEPFRRIVSLGVPALPFLMEKIEQERGLVYACMSQAAARILKRKDWKQGWVSVWWKTKRPKLPQEFGAKYRAWEGVRAGPDPRKRATALADLEGLGVLVLPMLVDKAAAGDSGLIPVISRLTDGAVPPGSTTRQVATWWQRDKAKWTLPQETPNPLTSEAETSQEPPTYDQRLSEYLSRIDACVADRKSRLAQFVASGKERREKLAAELSKDESGALEDLRARARKYPGGKLMFVGVCRENDLVIPDSEASSRVFAALLKEGLADPGPLTERIASLSMWTGLSPGWASLLEGFVTRKNPRWELAVEVLYRAGVSKGAYRPMLQKWAEAGKVSAARALLFRLDPDTGEPQAVPTPENRALLKKLSVPVASPEIRAACANYAAESGDRSLAERICTEILSLPYRGHGDGDDLDAVSRAADGELHRGRVEALSVLFFKVKSPSAYRQVYDIANHAWTERDHPETLAPQWRHFSRYTGAQVEIDFAKSVLSEVHPGDEK